MTQKYHFFGNIEETDKAVRKMCAVHLPENFTLENNIKLLDENNSSIDDSQKYYCYFLYCWELIYRTYLAERFDDFNSLPITKKTFINNRITLDPVFLSTHPNIFLFHIVLATEEYLEKNPYLHTLGSDGTILSLVGKIRALMSSIDVISLQLYGKTTMTLSYIPYIIRRNIEGINFDNITKTINSAEKKFNDIVNDSRWEDISTFLTNSAILESKIKEQDNLLNTVNSLNDKLNNTKSDFNFLNLSQAFTNIRNIKQIELKKINIGFYSMAALLLLTPIILLLFNLYGDTDKFTGWNKLLYILPVATIEIILLYFLRIFYIQKNSVTAQLLQIDFRLSICEFIKNYVDDRTISDKDKDTWSAFEALIFSPIQLREDKIPSVLDGTDSIAEFVNKVFKVKRAGSQE